MSNDTSTSEDTARGDSFLTPRQKGSLAAIAMLMSVVLGLQSYGILPYQMGDVRNRLTSLETTRRDDRDLLIALQAQLVAAREELRLLRSELVAWRSELAGRRLVP